MSRSRSRKYYEDYGDDEEYFEAFSLKNRRRNKQKKLFDRETFDNEEEENANLYLQK